MCSDGYTSGSMTSTPGRTPCTQVIERVNSRNTVIKALGALEMPRLEDIFLHLGYKIRNGKFDMSRKQIVYVSLHT